MRKDFYCVIIEMAIICCKYVLIALAFTIWLRNSSQNIPIILKRIFPFFCPIFPISISLRFIFALINGQFARGTWWEQFQRHHSLVAGHSGSWSQRLAANQCAWMATRADRSAANGRPSFLCWTELAGDSALKRNQWCC